MTLENGTRRDLQPELLQMLNEFDGLSDVGGENRALGRFCEITQEIVT